MWVQRNKFSRKIRSPGHFSLYAIFMSSSISNLSFSFPFFFQLPNKQFLHLKFPSFSIWSFSRSHSHEVHMLYHYAPFSFIYYFFVFCFWETTPVFLKDQIAFIVVALFFEGSETPNQSEVGIISCDLI